jgi:hypothetical protein
VIANRVPKRDAKNPFSRMARLARLNVDALRPSWLSPNGPVILGAA